MLIRIKLSLVSGERDSQMKGRTGILDVYFPRLQIFYSMKSFDVKYVYETGIIELAGW